MSSHKKYLMNASSNSGAEPEFLRPHDVAARLGISRMTVLRLLKSGKLPGFKVGRSWVVNRAALDKLLANLSDTFAAREQP